MDSKTLIEAYDRARESSPAAASEDRYREEWRWDKVTRGTHCVDCYPGNCPMRVYIRDGKVVREEQAGDIGVIEPGVIEPVFEELELGLVDFVDQLDP